MLIEFSNNIHMWLVFAIIGISFYLYADQKIPMELTALGIIISLMLLFFLMPFEAVPFDYQSFLYGFTNPALVTLLCLLVLGEGLSRTGVLDKITAGIISLTIGYRVLALLFMFVTVLIVSGFLNNIPVVVLFIPIIINLCRKFHMRPGQHMMTLSFVSILGGMTTLIGSSTNLLVSSSLVAMGVEGFSFFTFTLPGLFMVFAGCIYIFCIMPFIMKNLGEQNLPSETYDRAMVFTQFKISPASSLIGQTADEEGNFIDLPDGVNVQFVKRGEKVFRHPFNALTLKTNDIMVVEASAEEFENLTNNKTLSLFANMVSGHSFSEVQEMGRAEVVVVPHSPMIKRTISNIRFFDRYNCVVLGIKRRKERITKKIDDIKLEGGDVLLLQGKQEDLLQLRRSRNMILMEHSLIEVSKALFVKRSLFIFSTVILLAGTGTLPILLATLLGVAAMLASRIVTIAQALNVLDAKIILVVAASLALGIAMQITGGANFIAILFIDLLVDSRPEIILSIFFLVTALLSNMLSTKATAILFTPIAVNIAASLDVHYLPFAIAVVFASNCSFASPIGYQTNLLVMGPGGYEFKDFLKAGLPLLFVCWIVFTLLGVYWFEL